MSSQQSAEELHIERSAARMTAAWISLVVGILLFGIKYLAYTKTGSASILSDALESIVNIAAAAMVVATIYVSSKPADENHPYGHGKIEDFSAGAEGAFIVLAAIAIFFAAVPRFFNPQPISDTNAGAVLIVIASVANLLLGSFLVRQGRRHHSRALEADGIHVLSDVISSVGAIVAIFLVKFSGVLWIDPLIACLIAVNILVSGLRLVKESVSRLMDEADDELLGNIAQKLSGCREDHWIDVHNLRAWRSGDVFHVDCHLTLPFYWNLVQGHDAGDAMEECLKALLGPHGEGIVHIDGCKASDCKNCKLEPCAQRRQPFEELKSWDRAWIIREGPGDSR